MVFSVQHVMLNAALLEHVADELGDLDGYCTYEHRLAGLVSFNYSVYDSFVLCLLMRVYRILPVVSDYRLVGRYNDYVHVVDVAELVFLGLCRTGHSGELVVHSEVVLEGDGCESLGL